MCHLILTILCFVYSSCLLSFVHPKSSQTPVILLHGFLGYGRNERNSHLGYYYWGKKIDLQERLKEEGYQVYTAKVGPLSSGWDRACELYAQIKGTRVDYGEEHSRTHHHKRFGKDYTGQGFYPKWGTIDPVTGEKQKIIIIAHSQGGVTARILAHLLEKGYPNQGLSPLFNNNIDTSNFIKSIVTMSTPHNGSTLSDHLQRFAPIVVSSMTFSASMLGSSDKTEYVWDLMLDHFGFYRYENETLYQYLNRTLNNCTFLYNKDTAYWEVTPEGARELNRWVETIPHIYYFSFANYSTYESKKDLANGNLPRHKGGKGTSLKVKYYARYMGRYICNVDKDYPYTVNRCGDHFLIPDKKSRMTIDHIWWPNDGVVNRISMLGPLTDSKRGSAKHKIVHLDNSSETDAIRPGQWNVLGVLKDIDHFAITGGNSFFNNDVKIPPSFISKEELGLEEWYLRLLFFLQSRSSF